MKHKVAIPKSWLSLDSFTNELKKYPYYFVPYNVNDDKKVILDCDVLISDYPYLDKESLQSFTKLKLICMPGTGLDDYINIMSASKLNIAIANIKDYASKTIAEFTIALILNLIRKISLSESNYRSGIIDRKKMIGSNLYGNTLGLIGFGSVGKEVALLGNALGMNVICYTRSPSIEKEEKYRVKFKELDEVLKNSDIISLHLSLNDQTKNIIGKKEITKMKSSAILINTSRGKLVDTYELTKALKNNEIKGAALDVTEPEPLPKNHELFFLENVLLTPHIAANTDETILNSRVKCLENIQLFFQNDYRNIINKDNLFK